MCYNINYRLDRGWENKTSSCAAGVAQTVIICHRAHLLENGYPDFN
jgi:hypothetical protein